MIIKEVVVQNYRKFKNASISFTTDITLLAGSNNSGKTTFIDLLKSMIESGKRNYSAQDIPVIEIKRWSDLAFDLIFELFDNNLEKDIVIKSIIEEIFGIKNNDPKSNRLIPPTIVKLRIDYCEDDDIRNFANYIMDLDPDLHSFFFIFSYHVSQTLITNQLINEYEKLKSRYDNIVQYIQNSSDEDNFEEKLCSKKQVFKDKLVAIYAASIIGECYYTDYSVYSIDLIETAYFAGAVVENLNILELNDFRKLFNFKNIQAGRSLDDQSNGKFKNLSKNLIELASHKESWKFLFDKLPDNILKPIEDAEIVKTVREVSEKELNETIKSIAETNGGHTGKMIIDIDITEDSIRDLINSITNAKYQLDDYYLSEASQGLGYSNMIYILLQLENYKREIDPLLVNFFVIEEPESHMHPQMQRVFGKYLHSYYKNQKIQGLITTHSSEIVRTLDMQILRVARSFDFFNSIILDFSDFKSNISGNEVIDNFYNWFYEIGFSDVIFADRVIFYEGDTERMFIRKLTKLERFEKLNNLYIAFVQVGGAYLHIYRKLIEFLKIKSLMITDIDYDKTLIDKASIELSNITNESIKEFYKITHPDSNPTVTDLYSWNNGADNILFDNYAYISYQGMNDGFARTLEEAMLAKIFRMNIFEKKNREEWIAYKNRTQLKFTIPSNSGDYCIRDIILHSSSKKIDFMYSVILNNLTESMLPEYIEKGLLWLVQ